MEDNSLDKFRDAIISETLGLNKPKPKADVVFKDGEKKSKVESSKNLLECPYCHKTIDLSESTDNEEDTEHSAAEMLEDAVKRGNEMSKDKDSEIDNLRENIINSSAVDMIDELMEKLK